MVHPFIFSAHEVSNLDLDHYCSFNDHWYYSMCTTGAARGLPELLSLLFWNYFHKFTIQVAEESPTSAFIIIVAIGRLLQLYPTFQNLIYSFHFIYYLFISFHSFIHLFIYSFIHFKTKQISKVTTPKRHAPSNQVWHVWSSKIGDLWAI